MTEILWMSLNLIELLTYLQLIMAYNTKQTWWQQYQTTSNKKDIVKF